MQLTADEYAEAERVLKASAGLTPPMQFVLASFALSGADEIAQLHCAPEFLKASSAWRAIYVLSSGLIATLEMTAELKDWMGRSGPDGVQAPQVATDARLRVPNEIGSLMLIDSWPRLLTGTSLDIAPTWSVIWSDGTAWNLTPAKHADDDSRIRTNLLVLCLRELLASR